MDKKKIVIAEDDKDIRRLLYEYLTGWGYEVFQACDGQEGLKLDFEVKPALVISAIMMPNMDGNQFLKAFKETDIGRKTPFFILSSRFQMRDYFEVVGVDGFLEKPFNSEDMEIKIRSVFGGGEKKSEEYNRVLIAGSNETIVEKMAELLRAEKYHVDLVVSSDQVVSKAVLFLPNVIIVDAEYKDAVSSPEIIKTLRQMPQFKNVSILTFNADSSEKRLSADEIRQRDTNAGIAVNACLNEGATEYIGRFDEKVFVENLEKYLCRGRIVIIDDEVTTIKIIENMLIRDGYKVYIASDGKSGLEIVKKVKPNLIILDLVMPQMDGYEVMKILKDDESLKKIPVIMLSIKSEEGDINKGLDLEADDYVTKPFHTRLLLKRIEMVIRKTK